MSLTDLLALLPIVVALIGCPAFLVWAADYKRTPANCQEHPHDSQPPPKCPHSH